jgi:hypothetical protein
MNDSLGSYCISTIKILSVSLSYSSNSSITMPLSEGCTINRNESKKAVTAQRLATIINAILQLNNIVEVKKLVNKAPPIFPAFPDEHHKPIKVPLPRLPNQLPNIAEQAGHPIDCIKPLIEKRKQNSNVFVYPFSAANPIMLITKVTTMYDPINRYLGL